MYGATIARNFVAYGFLLAGFTALLVAYQGAADPTSACRSPSTAARKSPSALPCATAASVLIMPRYAGDDLRTALAATFAALAAYGATAMRPETPVATFMALRRRMIGQNRYVRRVRLLRRVRGARYARQSPGD
ncbi:MAG: FUSC family protein [Rhodospirillales bacterium]